MASKRTMPQFDRSSEKSLGLFTEIFLIFYLKIHVCTRNSVEDHRIHSGSSLSACTHHWECDGVSFVSRRRPFPELRGRMSLRGNSILATLTVALVEALAVSRMAPIVSCAFFEPLSQLGTFRVKIKI